MRRKGLASISVSASDFAEAVEVCHRNGWTDGLPVIPPTRELVEHAIAVAGRDANEILGVYEDSMYVTVEKVAINAVMAGCLPEHLPVVLALAEAMLAGRSRETILSTGGAAFGFIVNGPVRTLIGMNSRGDGLGPGNRANASIGRALRLIQRNALGAVSGAGNPEPAGRPVFDRATLGTPARYTCYHVVENEEDFPQLLPVHVERGFQAGDSVVTLFVANWHQQVSVHTERTPEEVVETIAHYALHSGKLTHDMPCVVVIPPEVANLLASVGWSKRRLQNDLFEATARSRAWMKKQGFQAGNLVSARGAAPEQGDEDVTYALAGSAELILPVICGGPAGAFVDILYAYHGDLTSKVVRLPAGFPTQNMHRSKEA
jgi:hypothetical protein